MIGEHRLAFSKIYEIGFTMENFPDDYMYSIQFTCVSTFFCQKNYIAKI